MPSDRETILAAFFAALAPLETGGVKLQRGGTIPSRIPASGLVIMRDGDPGDPEITLSPLTFIYDHRVVLEILVEKKATMHSLMDSLCQQIGAIIEADRTLGGLVDWSQPLAPEPVDLATEGGEPIKANALEIELTYGTEHAI